MAAERSRAGRPGAETSGREGLEAEGWALADPAASVFGAIARDVRFVGAYFRHNLASAMEYRASFVTQCVGMVLNDALAFFFWWIYFARFPEIGGWGFRDVATLWAVAATSFGVVVVVFGNGHRLASTIAQGHLDYYLGLPKNPLLHVLVSRMSIAGWGDVGFGLIAFVVAGRLDLLSIGLFVVLVAISSAISLAFVVITGSLAFFIGSAETAAMQANGALITTSTYPGPMYRGWTKVLLYTALPAAFTAHIPVELMRAFDITLFGLLLAATLVFWAVALLVFRAGLRRYESGNLVTLRG